jgi:hypothetical protein
LGFASALGLASDLALVSALALLASLDCALGVASFGACKIEHDKIEMIAGRR